MRGLSQKILKGFNMNNHGLTPVENKKHITSEPFQGFNIKY
jgi:hypothetical protein